MILYLYNKGQVVRLSVCLLVGLCCMHGQTSGGIRLIFSGQLGWDPADVWGENWGNTPTPGASGGVSNLKPAIWG